MTKPREKTREELQAEIEGGKKKIRQFENREKMLRQKLFKEERRTRSQCCSILHWNSGFFRDSIFPYNIRCNPLQRTVHQQKPEALHIRHNSVMINA